MGVGLVVVAVVALWTLSCLGKQEDLSELHGRIRQLCIERCRHFYHDEDICGVQKGHFCAFVQHLSLDNHLQLIQNELEKVAPYEKNDREDALRWAVEDVVNEKHQPKKNDDHALAIELQ